MAPNTGKGVEGRRSVCSSLWLRVYRSIGSDRLRTALRAMVIRMEGGPAYSLTIREIFQKFYRVNVGLYTAGPCRMRPQVFHAGTSMGRYSSITDSVRTFTRNHPMNTKSTHGLFYNPGLGRVERDIVPRTNLVIGHGVWIGHNAIILPPTDRIGDGAIVTAGSVVYTNVPPYAIVSGFPARVTGYRFSVETVAELSASRWWEKPPAELSGDADYLRRLVAGSARGSGAAGESQALTSEEASGARHFGPMNKQR